MRINKSSILFNKESVPYLKIDFIKNYPKEKTLDTPEKIAQCVKNIFNLNKMSKEHTYVIAFNTKMKPITFFHLSHGIDDATFMQPKNILTRVLLTGAPSIVLIHSHPSGDTTPSGADIKATERIKEACNIIGISLLDHIIIGKDYYSMKEHNLV